MRSLVFVLFAAPCFAATTIDGPRLERLLGFTGRGARAPEGQVTTPLTPLPFRLLGTLRGRTSEQSLAAIEHGKRSLTVAVGDEIDGVEIVSIEQQELVVRREGRLERVGRGAPTPGAVALPSTPSRGQPEVRTLPGGLRSVNRRDVEAVIQNPLSIMNDVRLIPAMESGRMVGFRAPFVREGSAVSLLGLQAGDVIRSVNGQPIDNLERLMGLMQALQTSSRFEIGLERAGQRLTQSVEVR
ncbi:MAG: type II secretion system protein N [Myxococcota bacterium]